MQDTIRVSVRELVEAMGRSGDLSLEFTGSGRALEGIGAHRVVQSARTGDYAREIPVSFSGKFNNFTLQITGRMDGLFNEEGRTVIEEIKTTRLDPSRLDVMENPLHWAQLKIYCFIYSENEDLDGIEAQLTYYHLDTGELRPFRRFFPKEELSGFFHGLLALYVERLEGLVLWRDVRDRSIGGLEFPYPAYRPGQREMAVEVYRTIRERGQLIVQAATGIGKTMAVLFPVLKSLPEGAWTKVFYLTARTTGLAAAERALDELRERGLRLRSVTLTAKEKICFRKEAACTPEECEYALGYYDRLDRALGALTMQDAFSRPAVEELAGRHRVCPFELSLDLSLETDFVICDYNYAFDPRVYLQRYFNDGRGEYVFLVDEAHNLVNRAREMFSAEIRKQVFLDLRRPLRDELPEIHRSMGKINSALIRARRECERAGNFLSRTDPPGEIYPSLRDFVKLTEPLLTGKRKASCPEGLQDLFFSVRRFLKIAEHYDEHYVTCLERTGGDLRVKLFCLDPSASLRAALRRCGTSVLFSATLTPARYFREVLGCGDTVRSLEIGSPFPRENLCLLIAGGISTLYRLRERTKIEVARMISSIIRHRRGNYLLFFPSYEYMAMIYEVFSQENPETDTLLQRPGMTEEEREEFLARFSMENPRTLVGFAVMGGIFGEGIDLVGDRLTGAVVVGPGLPGISPENELIRDHFTRKGRSGFDYAYLYPGINRVLQAAGRVIRTERDRGIVLLIDERFSSRRYRSLLPSEWRPVLLRSPRHLEPILGEFWKEEEGSI